MTRLRQSFAIAYLLLLVLVAPIMAVYGQSTFQERFNCEKGMRVYCAAPTHDGGYIVCGGHFFSDTHKDVLAWPFLMKLDGQGAIQWTKLIKNSLFDAPTTIFQNADGDYITSSGYAADRGTTIYFDSSGNLKSYTIEFGGFASFPTKDTGIMLLTAENIFKLNKTGEREWQRAVRNTHANDSEALNTSMSATLDGNYIIAGTTRKFLTPANPYAIFAEQFSSTGDLFWRKTYYAIPSQFTFCSASCAMPDTGFTLFGGINDDFARPQRPYIIQCDRSGEVKWAREIYDVGFVNPVSVSAFPDGSILAIGDKTIQRFNSGSGFTNIPVIFFFKLSPDGTLLWTKYMMIPTVSLNARSVTIENNMVRLITSISSPVEPLRTGSLSVLDTSLSGCFLFDTLARLKNDTVWANEGYSVEFGDTVRHSGTLYEVVPGSVEMTELCLLDVPEKTDRKESELIVFPNPVVSTEMTIEYTGIEEGNYSATVSTLLGSEILQSHLFLSASGREHLALPAAAVAGMYQLILRSETTGALYTIRFIKQ